MNEKCEALNKNDIVVINLFDESRQKSPHFDPHI